MRSSIMYIVELVLRSIETLINDLNDSIPLKNGRLNKPFLKQCGKSLKLKMYCRWKRNYNRCMSKWKRKSIWYLFNFNVQSQNQFLKSNNPRNSQLYELAIQFQSRSSRCWNVILDHGQHKGAKAKNAQFHTGRFL